MSISAMGCHQEHMKSLGDLIDANDSWRLPKLNKACACFTMYSSLEGVLDDDRNWRGHGSASEHIFEAVRVGTMSLSLSEVRTSRS